MADFNTDSSTLGQIDSSQARELAISEQRGVSTGPSKFSVAMDALLPAGLTFASIKATQALNVALTAGAGAAFGGGQQGAMGGTGSPMFGGSSAGKFMTGSNIPAPPAPPGGGAAALRGLGAPPPPPGGGMAGLGGASGALPGSGADQFGGQIDSMFNNNVTFLMLQTKVQNMSQQFQAVSNIVKADHDARTNAIRNFRS